MDVMEAKKNTRVDGQIIEEGAENKKKGALKQQQGVGSINERDAASCPEKENKGNTEKNKGMPKRNNGTDSEKRKKTPNI